MKKWIFSVLLFLAVFAAQAQNNEYKKIGKRRDLIALELYQYPKVDSMCTDFMDTYNCWDWYVTYFFDNDDVCTNYTVQMKPLMMTYILNQLLMSGNSVVLQNMELLYTDKDKNQYLYIIKYDPIRNINSLEIYAMPQKLNLSKIELPRTWKKK